MQAAREERGGLAGLAGLDALALNQGPQVIWAQRMLLLLYSRYRSCKVLEPEVE